MIQIDNDPILAKLAEDISQAIDELEEYDDVHKLLKYEHIVNTNDILEFTGAREVELEFFLRYKPIDTSLEEALISYYSDIEDALILCREAEEVAMLAAQTQSSEPEDNDPEG